MASRTDDAATLSALQADMAALKADIAALRAHLERPGEALARQVRAQPLTAALIAFGTGFVGGCLLPR